MRYLKNISLVLGAIVLLVLGLDKIAGRPLVPGHDTGFEWRGQGFTQGPRIVLSTDAGDITCVVELRINSRAPAWTAALSNNAQLAVSEESLDAQGSLVFLSAQGKAAKEKFVWPSGVNILVLPDHGQSGDISVDDWKVYLSNDTYDSRSRSEVRKVWRRICLVLFVFGLISAGYSALAKREPTKPFTAQECAYGRN
jgi:hypothetical protein